MESPTGLIRLGLSTSYDEGKQAVALLVQESGNDREKHQFRELLAREQTFIHTTSPERVETAVQELEQIRFQIHMRLPDFQAGIFEHLMEHRVSMNNQLQAKQLFEVGKVHIANGAWDELKLVNSRLWQLLPDDEREAEELRLYTGIV